MNNSFVASSLLSSSSSPFFFLRSAPSFLSRANCSKVAPDEGVTTFDPHCVSILYTKSLEDACKSLQLTLLLPCILASPGGSFTLAMVERSGGPKEDGWSHLHISETLCLLFSSKRYLPPAARDAPEMRHARRRRERAIYGTRKSQGDS